MTKKRIRYARVALQHSDDFPLTLPQYEGNGHGSPPGSTPTPRHPITATCRYPSARAMQAKGQGSLPSIHEAHPLPTPGARPSSPAGSGPGWAVRSAYPPWSAEGQARPSLTPGAWPPSPVGSGPGRAVCSVCPLWPGEGQVCPSPTPGARPPSPTGSGLGQPVCSAYPWWPLEGHARPSPTPGAWPPSSTASGPGRVVCSAYPPWPIEGAGPG